MKDLTEKEILFLRDVLDSERRRLKNTDYNSEVIINSEEKLETAENLFFKCLNEIKNF